MQWAFYPLMVDELKMQILTFRYISYPSKPRCITPTFLQFKLYLCIKFKELNKTHLHIYFYPRGLTSMTGSCGMLCYRTSIEVE